MALLRRGLYDRVKDLREKIPKELLSQEERFLLDKDPELWKNISKTSIADFEDKLQKGKGKLGDHGYPAPHIFAWSRNSQLYIKQIRERLTNPLKKILNKLPDALKKEAEQVIKEVNELVSLMDLLGWFSQEKYWPGLRASSGYFFLLDPYNPQENPTKYAIERMIVVLKKIEAIL